MKPKAKPKQIKSFTVDGDAYSWLVERLKETDEKEFNVSILVNNHLNGLYILLKCILEYFDEQKLSIDRAWVINNFFRSWSVFPVSEDDEDQIKEAADDLFIEYHTQKRKLLEKRGKLSEVGYCYQCRNENPKTIVNQYGVRKFSVCNLLGREVNSLAGCDHFELKDGLRMIKGVCYQCRYENNDVCSVKRGIVGYDEHCDRFKAKDGINEEDLDVGLGPAKKKEERKL